MKTKHVKREEAKARQAAHDKLTTKQKLDQAVGKKERARLEHRLVAEKNARKVKKQTTEEKMEE